MYKFILITLSTILFLSSCQKHKDKKLWKSYHGIYTTVNNEKYTILDSLEFNQIEVTDAGISILTPVTTFNMNVYTRDLNDNPNYEYKCEYNNMISYSFTEGGLNNSSMSIDEFNQGRKFYLTFSDNQLLFTIIGTESIENIKLIR